MDAGHHNSSGIVISKGHAGSWFCSSGSHRSSTIASEDGVPWSLTNSLFADMGGFVFTEGMPEVINEGKESMIPALLAMEAFRRPHILAGLHSKKRLF
jgi:hypothetical protein